TAEGMRIDPAVSVPRVVKEPFDATAAPEPPLEPPGILSRFQGLCTGPKCGELLSMPHAYSCMFNFPVSTAPASRRLTTTDASSWETQSPCMFEAMVMTSPPI